MLGRASPRDVMLLIQQAGSKPANEGSYIPEPQRGGICISPGATRGLEFGHFKSASPWEPVIFHVPSRAAVRCGPGSLLSEINLR